MSKLLVRYPVNKKGRTFIIGDLHGCWDLFCAILVMINFDFEVDIMYSTGDLIDREKDSIRCLLLVKEKWFRAVKGNHEEFLIEAAENCDFDWDEWKRRGGVWAHYLSREELVEYAALAAALPTVIVVGEGEERFNVFHAEWYGSDEKLDELENKERAPLELQQGRAITEGRVGSWVHYGLSTSYVGHTITSKVRRRGSQVYIDTGGYMSVKRQNDYYGLTVVEHATGKQWRASSNSAQNKE